VMLFSFGTQLLGSRRVLVVALTGMLLVLLGSLVLLLFQGAYVTGGGWGDLGTWSLVNEVMRTRVGIAVIARIVLVVLWMVTVQSLRRSPWTSVTSLVVWLLTVLTALTFSVSGHPSAGTLTGIFVPVDAAHLTGIAVWVGGLFSVLLVKREMSGNPLVTPAVDRFSRHATWAMPLVVISGVVQTLHLSNGIPGLGGSSWGRFVIAKFALVLVAVILGTRARRSLTMRGTSSIVSLVRVEAVIAVVVLGLSAALVSTSPDASNGQVPTFSASLAQKNIIAEVSISPARVGGSEIHVLFTPPGGAITPVKAVKVRMELPSRGVPAVPVEMIEIGANHWSGVVQFPYAGDWTVEILVTPHDNAQIRYSTVAGIKG
jgi:copper transport protein